MKCICIMQKHLYAETQRCWNVLMVMETTNGEKMPGTSKWKNANFERYLLNDCVSDCMFVVTQISTVLDGIKKNPKKKLQKKDAMGFHPEWTVLLCRRLKTSVRRSRYLNSLACKNLFLPQIIKCMIQLTLSKTLVSHKSIYSNRVTSF